MRNAFADAVYDLAKDDPRICVVVADISPAGSMERFRAEFPDRFINVGVAEQAMIGIAAGLAMRGMRPFCYTIAPFALFRPFEFVRCDLAYQNLSVTVVGMGAGLSYPSLGPTHHATEDVAIALACPNLAVAVPCDPGDVRRAVRWCAGRRGPTYLRLGKTGEPDLPAPQKSAAFGGLRLLRGGPVGAAAVLTYGPIADYVLREPVYAGRAVYAARVLRPIAFRELAALLTRGDVLVVEEASSAPLYHDLLALKNTSPGTFRDDVQSRSLPRAFIEEVGVAREGLLEKYLTGGVAGYE